MVYVTGKAAVDLFERAKRLNPPEIQDKLPLALCGWTRFEETGPRVCGRPTGFIVLDVECVKRGAPEAAVIGRVGWPSILADDKILLVVTVCDRCSAEGSAQEAFRIVVDSLLEYQDRGLLDTKSWTEQEFAAFRETFERELARLKSRQLMSSERPSRYSKMGAKK